jgi:nucleoside-diphosphate-sugar epimerase
VKALVTGSAGFLGRHFTAELRSRGWAVAACDIVEGRDALARFAQADRMPFDLVVHCAAVAPHRAAIDGQPMHLAQNLHLDSAMFDWAVRTGQKRVLYISSSAAYPTILQGESARGTRLREQWCHYDAGQPDAGYGWAKLTGERMAADARKAGLPVTVVRPFSGYGEDQGFRWPFGAFITRVRQRADPFVIWGDGTQVRDWIHVSDLVAGALAVVESGTEDPVNLCTGEGTSMRDLVDMACRVARHKPEIELLTDRPQGVAYRVGDPARMNRYYTAKVDLAEGVRRALA